MISDIDLARRLFPRPADVVREARAGIPSTSQVRGYATGDSADGTVTVVLDAEAGGNDAEMEVPTLGGIAEGAEVLVTLLDGTPVDCSQAGSIDGATATAVDAKAVAEAVGQHVWTDDDGLHVTEVGQDEWNDAEGASYRSGMNVLVNSLGQLFRHGLDNLLAIVSGSSPAVAIYDGGGNEDGNIVAKFASDLIELGKGSANAVISLCGGLGTIGYNSNYVGTLTVNGGSNPVVVTSNDSASLQTEGGYVGSNLDGVFARSDYLTLMDADESVSEDFPMSSVIDAVPVTLYDNASASASASATLSESAANFKRMTIFYRDADNNFSSVDVWSPNGKRVVLDLTWINGTSAQDMYQRVRWVTISGTTIGTYKGSGDAKYRTGQVKLDGGTSVTNADYIAITHVIGYR